MGRQPPEAYAATSTGRLRFRCKSRPPRLSDREPQPSFVWSPRQQAYQASAVRKSGSLVRGRAVTRVYSVNLASESRKRCAKTRSNSMAMLGCCRSSARNFHRSSPRHSVFSRARMLADRRCSSSNAISPKNSPGLKMPSRADLSVCKPFTTSTLPKVTTYSLTPNSPSFTITSPAAYCRGTASKASCPRLSLLSPENIGTLARVSSWDIADSPDSVNLPLHQTELQFTRRERINRGM